MSKIYQTTETAIRNIKQGKPLHWKVFSKYWNRKDEFLELAKAGAFVGDWEHKKFPFWISSWRWEEEYVIEIFNAQQELWDGIHSINHIDWLMDGLPDSITSSKEYLSLCSRWNRLSFRLTGPAREEFDRSLYLSKRQNGEVFREIFEDHADIFKQDIKTTRALINHFELAPASIINDRDYCLKFLQSFPWFLSDLPGWRDDIDFAIDLFNLIPDFNIYPFSYRLRKIVKDQDPKTSLMRYKLESTLATKPELHKPKVHKI